MFRWGILGLGRIAQKFAKELLETGVGTISAVGSRDRIKAEVFSQSFGGQPFESYDDLIDNGHMDAVYIAVPHPMHLKLALKCLEKKIPVLCEKPFTMNSRELKELILQAKNSDIFLMEAMWSRFIPHIKWMKENFDAGSFGKIIHLKAEFSFKGKERGLRDGVKRLIENELGGGALLDIGIYPLFLSHLFCGSPSTIQASARLVNDIDESCHMLLTYDHGSTAFLDCSIIWESEGRAELYFEKCSIIIPQRWHESNEIIIKYTDQESITKKWDYPSRGFVYEIQEVQKCVSKGEKESKLMPLDFSMEIMQTMDKIREKIGLKYQADRL